MKKLSIALTTMSIGFATLANAEIFYKDSLYVGGGLGLFAARKFKETEDSLYLKKTAPKGKPSVMYNLFVGYRFNEYFRADINGQYRRMRYSATVPLPVEPQLQSSKQTIRNLSMFLNGYANLSNSSIFVPYITMGVGYSRNNAGTLRYRVTNLPIEDADALGKNTNNFAWNAGLGTSVKVCKNVELDISYRYADLGKVKIRPSASAAGSSFDAASQKLRLHQGLISVIYNI